MRLFLLLLFVTLFSPIYSQIKIDDIGNQLAIDTINNAYITCLKCKNDIYRSYTDGIKSYIDQLDDGFKRQSYYTFDKVLITKIDICGKKIIAIASSFFNTGNSSTNI